MHSIDRTNHTLIERYIDNYDCTAIGQDIRNMYENGSSYESICDSMGICHEDYREE